MRYVLLFLGLTYSFLSISKDTLYTHPNYPPLVFSKGEVTYYHYTAKYIPKSLYHAFKILVCDESEVITRFKERSVEEVVNKGIYYNVARTRKEFCLDSYSDFSLSFHRHGIYYPHAMETFILLGLHQYLNQEKISWKGNKKIALLNFKKENRVWKRRKRKLFRKGEPVLKESKKKKEENEYEKAMKGTEDWFWEYLGEDEEE